MDEEDQLLIRLQGAILQAAVDIDSERFERLGGIIEAGVANGILRAFGRR